MKYKATLLALCLILLLSGCAPAPSITAPETAATGAYCLPYTPKGQSVYDSSWTGEYPAIESTSKNYETATFGLGCFWGPAAEFAVIDGVLRTRVGYTGGDSLTPSYENLGNHIEVIEVDYDPAVISYRQLIEAYFSLYDATVRPYSQRVKSMIYYRTEDEKQIANTVKEEVFKRVGSPLYTEIDPLGVFYLAEDRHQLYYLKQEPSLYREITEIFPTEKVQLLSVLASKLNGFIAGYGTAPDLDKVLSQSGLSEASLARMTYILTNR